MIAWGRILSKVGIDFTYAEQLGIRLNSYN